MTVAVVVALVLLAFGGAASVAARRARTREAGRSHIPVADALAEVLAVASGGGDRDRVRAVRLLRERTGLGLVEADRTVLRWLEEEAAGPHG
ncbi:MULTISPECIES: hypothetical protein [unclassified Blastococcus]|uniref:hypothetical protein n=1 Tax=unclassified Blastococcus TaxID=2619396 RepID=UPI001F5BAED4|nr:MULTISPECIES: hypothetical protein [unclassified Blastococcus]